MLSGCRISHQLRDYNPSHLGIYACNNHHNFSNGKPSPPVPCIFPLASNTKFFRLKLFGTSASSSSSSSSSALTNDNDDLARVSFFNKDGCVQNAARTPLLSDCLSPDENGRDPPSERMSPVAGGIVALGKFDALHIGHRELAIQAAKIGVPFLLSFVGMAEILGWEPRPPIVAQCDRKRVLSSWAPFCGNIIPKEFQVEFSKVRYLTPQKFVEKLSEDLEVRGVVAGQNYRFGYKAAGDASDLVRLCKEYDMRACIINSVMDKNQESRDIGTISSKEQGQVSSTRVRHALAIGDMKYVSELLGRPHRLILKAENKETLSTDGKRLSAPRSCLLNLPPKEGLYENCSLMIDDGNTFPCRVIVDAIDLHLELDNLDTDIYITGQKLQLLSIDFGESVI